MAASTPSLMSSLSHSLFRTQSHTHARTHTHYKPAYWHKLPHADIYFESLTAELWVILFCYRHEGSDHKKGAAAGGETFHLPALVSWKLICYVGPRHKLFITTRHKANRSHTQRSGIWIVFAHSLKWKQFMSDVPLMMRCQSEEAAQFDLLLRHSSDFAIVLASAVSGTLWGCLKLLNHIIFHNTTVIRAWSCTALFVRVFVCVRLCSCVFLCIFVMICNHHGWLARLFAVCGVCVHVSSPGRAGLPRLLFQRNWQRLWGNYTPLLWLLKTSSNQGLHWQKSGTKITDNYTHTHTV